MLSIHIARDFSRFRRIRRRGFSLSELLVVMGIVAILSGIALGVSRSTSALQQRSRAQAELVALSGELEQYKAEHGDYPVVLASTPEQQGYELLCALAGISPQISDSHSVVEREEANPASSQESTPELALSSGILDPWGRPYVYLYDPNDAAWDNFGFVLFAEGSDGSSEAIPEDGILSASWRASMDNLDNLYPGE